MILLATHSAFARAPQSVVADPTVEPIALSSFDSLSPSQVFLQLDELEFWAVPRSIPAGYYAGVDASSAASLRDSLHERISNHRIFPYSHSSRPSSSNHQVDTWDIIAIADAHPEDPSRVLDIYHNNTLNRQLAGVTSNPRYDREHSWPKSLGFPDQNPRNAAYNDCHHLFAAYQSYNASRSNKPYGEREEDPQVRRPTVENVGRGGGLSDEPESSNYSFSDVWQTWIGRRGDVARAMFYMDVRYEGGQRDGVGEPDLQLSDDIAAVTQRNVWASGGVAFMGVRATLFKWHVEDPVDDLERRRNTVVFLFQGNRNPFIDHPEWVAAVYGVDLGPTDDDTTGVLTSTSPTGDPGATAVAWINEIHYDNVGADVGEFVEIAGAAGLTLSGWRLVLYNGTGGRSYREIPLSGVLPDAGEGFGFVSVAAPEIQNGDQDGVALVDPAGNVVELLSYEGTFTATDGPAADRDAIDVGVAETKSTPIGHSLGRTGNGRAATAFRFAAPGPATPGGPNPGQTFGP